jgi:hypothetical protein
MENEISRLRRLAGLNESHDPATEQLLDQACDCAQPDCERCNPEAVVESEETMADAYSRFMTESEVVEESNVNHAGIPHDVWRSLQPDMASLIEILYRGGKSVTVEGPGDKLEILINERPYTLTLRRKANEEAVSESSRWSGHANDPDSGLSANEAEAIFVCAEEEYSPEDFLEKYAGDLGFPEEKSVSFGELRGSFRHYFTKLVDEASFTLYDVEMDDGFAYAAADALLPAVIKAIEARGFSVT